MQAQNSSSLSFKSDLKNKLQHIANTGKAAGVSFAPYTNYSINLFQSLEPTIQSETLKAIASYCAILNEVTPDPFKVQYESDLLREASKKLNLSIPEDFVSTIKRGDICEVYHMKSRTQIYRNFEFLKHCSYDPCLMLIKSWPELFERDPLIEEALFKRAMDVTNYSTKSEPWGLENHIISERLSKDRNEFEVVLKNIAPCFHTVSGERIGWASTIRVNPLGSHFRDKPNITPIK